MSAPTPQHRTESWTQRNPCPVCGGHERIGRGKGERCHGFRSSDGKYLHCTREEHAGTLSPHKGGDTFAHRAEGACRCGVTHGSPVVEMMRLLDRLPAKRDTTKTRKTWPTHEALIDEWKRAGQQVEGKRFDFVEAYTYEDANRKPVLVVLRFEHEENGERAKTFRQATQQPDGWAKTTEGVELIPYRLPELSEAIEAGKPVYVAEGEKDCDALVAAGYVATCNPMGAGKDVDLYAEHFVNAKVVRVVADLDENGIGQKHAHNWARVLRPVVERVELFAAVKGKDAYDALVVHGLSIDEAFRPLEHEGDSNAAPAWEPPVPIVNVEAVPFPLFALPASMRDLAQTVSEQVDAPADLVAMSSLGVVASMLTTGRIFVGITDSWKEPLNLYLAALAESGVGKGPATALTQTPLSKIQAELQEQEQERVTRGRLRWEVKKKRAEKLLNAAANAEDEAESERLMQEAETAADALAATPRPEMPRLFVTDDVTPQALSVAMAANGECLSVLSAEGNELFEVLAGKHAANGGTETRLFNSAWNGECCDSLRIGRGETRLNKPFLTVSLALQPGAFDRKMRLHDLEELGVFNRFLFSRPDYARDLEAVPEANVPVGTRERWRFLVADLRHLPEAPCELRFNSAAAIRFNRLRGRIREMQKEGGLLAGFAGYGPKLEANAARLAGVLHFAEAAEHGETGRAAFEPIEESTVERAVALVEYFAAHAARTFGLAGLDEPLRNAERVRDWVHRRLEPVGTGRDQDDEDRDQDDEERDQKIEQAADGRLFVRVRTILRDLAHSSRGRLNGRNDLDAALKVLEERGWLRVTKMPRESAGKSGPSPDAVELSPLAFPTCS